MRNFQWIRNSYPAMVFSLCLLWTPVSLAQDSSGKVSVYYEIDSTKAIDLADIDREIEDLKNADRIRIVGYADYLGEDEYNAHLSSSRAELIRKYLLSQGVIRSRIVSTEGKGELPSQSIDAEGNPEHRRVDVFFEYSKTAPESQEKVLLEEPIEESFEIDSTNRENIVLEGLSFIGGRHFPTRESMPVLYKLAETMKKYPDLEIEIQGYICCEYEEKDGMDNDTGEPHLSLNRARFVYDFLVDSGVDPDRLSYVGLGSTQPKVFPERSPEDQQANRRVEIKVTKYPD